MLFVITFLLIPNCISSSISNIVFDLPDLVAVYEDHQTNETIQLEAFKSTENDKILNERNNKRNFNKLTWVSIGNPIFEINNQGKIFHYTQYGFYAYVNMLTKDQRKLFVENINYKHSVRVTIQQIINLPLTKFVCSLRLYQDNRKYLINGEVINFGVFPLRLDFLAPINSHERELFEKLNTKEDFQISCDLASHGTIEKFNTLKITTNQMNQLSLIDSLFGPANTTFITREQMNALSMHIYTNLDIVEEYQMPEYEFKETFSEDLIKQVSQNLFTMVDFDMAFNKISKFSLNYNPIDLHPNVVKTDAGRLFKIVKNGNRSILKYNLEGIEQLKQKGAINSGGGGNGTLYGIITINAGCGGGEIFESDLNRTTKSFEEQLNDLNKIFRDEVQWEFSGNKIIPKSLNVARIIKSSFFKTLTFKRIRKQTFEAPFNRHISLYTNHFKDK